jgi:hypothetical protein
MNRPEFSVADVEVGFDSVAVIGIGSNACSRNSKMCGLMIVSSGMLCNVIQAKRLPFLFDILPLWTHR